MPPRGMVETWRMDLKTPSLLEGRGNLGRKWTPKPSERRLGLGLIMQGAEVGPSGPTVVQSKPVDRESDERKMVSSVSPEMFVLA